VYPSVDVDNHEEQEMMMKTLLSTLAVCSMIGCVAEEPVGPTENEAAAPTDEAQPDTGEVTSALEPDPCAGRSSDSGTGGDYYDGQTGDHLWSIRRIYGTWYNCGGPAGQADRVRIDVATDTDGPCISVPYHSDGSSTFTRLYKIIPSTFRSWVRC
jgi:hypothetical protein